MSIKATDIVPFNQLRARLTELAEDVRNGSEKIITRNGESYIALIDARRLDYYHQLEQEHLNLILMDDAIKGMEDVVEGRHIGVAEIREKYKIKNDK